MRIVFIGAVEFSWKALEKLLALDADVVGVCTQPAAGVNADFADLGELCRSHGILCRLTSDVNEPESIDWISGLKPDIIFCLGWSRLLKADLLQIAPRGVVGFHPSALPENRGRHPLIWALALGLEKTASSFFFMEEGADTGDIISQVAIDIDPEDDAGSLYRKMTETALVQLAALLPRLEAGTVTRTKQELAGANAWRKRGEADGRIDWRMSAAAIHNLVRALAKPYVGAHFVLKGEKITVWKSKVLAGGSKNIEPGKVLHTDDGAPAIKCGEGQILLLDTEPDILLIPGDYL